MRRAQVRFILGIKNMEGEIVIKRWEDLDGEVSSYRLCCILSTLPPSTLHRIGIHPMIESTLKGGYL